MSHDEAVIVLAGSIIALLFAAIVYFSNRRSKAIRSIFMPIVTGAGWSALEKRPFIAPGVKGVWRSLPAQLSYYARQKSVPSRLVLTLRAPNASRLVVQRRTKGLFHNRPATWFGPPLVEVHHPAAQELWIRSDEPAFADRVFADDKLVSMISKNLPGAFDEIRIDGKGVRITRSMPDTFGFRLDTPLIETTARDEIAMAEALLRKIA